MSLFSTQRIGFFKKEKQIVASLSLLALFLRIPLAFRPQSELTQLPYGDDAFYLFSIAKNIARGFGPTVDGTHLTNGFQPLIVFLYTPIFWLCGRDVWLAIRWTFILNGIIAALTVWAVWFAIRSLQRNDSEDSTQSPTFYMTPVRAAALWTFSISMFVHTTNGLETGLSSLLIVIALALYARVSTTESKSQSAMLHPIFLGVVLGLTILARIDAAILVVLICIMEIYFRRFRSAAMIALMALLISAPWWIYNLQDFGSLMPTSGQAEKLWPVPPGESIYRSLQAVTDIVPILVYAPSSMSFAVRSVICGACIVIIFALAWRVKLIQYLRAKTNFAAILPFAIFSLPLLIYYTFFFKAPHFIPRYMQPMRIMWLVIFILAAPAISAFIKRYVRANVYRGLLSLAIALALAFGINRYSTNFFNIKDSADFYDFGIFATEHPEYKIGMLQSGIASFIAPNVINLDGKVNFAALRAHQQGRLAEYLRNENLTYIADLKPFIEDIATIARKDELYFDSVAMIGDIQLMKRRDR